MTHTRFLICTLAACLVTLQAGYAAAQGAPPAVAPANADTFTDWSLHTSGEGGQKVCYAATTVKQPGAGPANRSESVVYISAWPKDGIKSEVSIKLGYPAKSAAGVKVSVGSDTFKLFIKSERAFVADATQELKLVEAMKKGSKLTVEATTDNGTVVTDSYSLSGITQALQAQAAACP